MAKDGRRSRALVPTGRSDPVGVPPRGRMLAGTSIPPIEAFRVPALRPRDEGPWTSEYDKLAWRDPATGLDCILRRDADGALHGYVAVGPDHPFHGVSADALPHDPPLRVHGGIDYAEPCDADEPRETSICHVGGSEAGPVAGWRSTDDGGAPPSSLPASVVTGSASRLHGVDAWWFGFGADKSYDLVPGHGRHVAPLATENGRVYRDERYMVRETTALALQLHAVAAGAAPPEIGTDRPPVGLDPQRPRG